MPTLHTVLLSSTLAAPLLFASGQTPARPVPAAAGPAAVMVDITLERKRDNKIEQMAVGHVFQPGDVIRLRLKSHYSGFLYVLDQGTSGKFANIFPSTEAGSNNRVIPDRDYFVPAVEQGWFEVEGPAGFDLLYFLLSPSPLATPTLSSATAPGPVSSLRPRCNDEIFRARGDCQDDSAGPAAVPRGVTLPPALEPLARGATRDLVFVQEGPGTVGVTTPPSSAPVLYTFRLAHL